LKKSKESGFWPLLVFQVHSLNPFSFLFLIYTFQRTTADCPAFIKFFSPRKTLFPDSSFLKESVCYPAEAPCLHYNKARRLEGATIGDEWWCP